MTSHLLLFPISVSTCKRARSSFQVSPLSGGLHHPSSCKHKLLVAYPYMEAPATCVIEASGAPARFRVSRRAVVTTLEVAWSASGAPEGTYCLWALFIPHKSQLSGDNAYVCCPPVVLSTGVLSKGDTTTQIILQRWEMEAGSRVVLLLADASVLMEVVTSRLCPMKESADAAVATKDPIFHNVTFRMSGLYVGPTFDSGEREWTPLVWRRWFELKNYVREATILERPVSIPAVHGRAIAKHDFFSMYKGDVKEASAISTNSQFIRWADGSVGAMDELKPFYRDYVAARPEKTIRVRRFPHRYADVVGEVPPATILHAHGRHTDPFFGEQYALVLLPEDGALAHHVITYDLSRVPAGYLWGWTKIAGRSGQPLLVEAGDAVREGAPRAAESAGLVSSSAASGEPTFTELSERSFYTSVRDSKVVRIRKSPSLKAEVVGRLEPNEVKEAVRLWHVPAPIAKGNADEAVGTEFIEWKDGGFSLVKNAEFTYVSPVNTVAPIRRFPLRSRQSRAHDADDNAVVNLDALKRQRRRNYKRVGEDDSASELTDASSE